MPNINFRGTQNIFGFQNLRTEKYVLCKYVNDVKKSFPQQNLLGFPRNASFEKDELGKVGVIKIFFGMQKKEGQSIFAFHRSPCVVEPLKKILQNLAAYKRNMH